MDIKDKIKRKLKIAVADDQKLFRQGLISLLEEFDELKVNIEVDNGQELLTEMKREEPDVILLDLEMPVMDGIVTTDFIRKKYPEVKIIILTSHDDDSFITHLLEKGANGFLLKDADIDIVVDAIYDVVETGFHFNDRVSKAMVKGLVKNNRVKPTFTNDVQFTSKEIEIIQLICKERTAKEISELLNLSVRTIEGHREIILKKTGARNTAGIVMFAVKNNLVE
ncbi:MAG: response regulator [Bacteroidia bacterium]